MRPTVHQLEQVCDASQDEAALALTPALSSALPQRDEARISQYLTTAGELLQQAACAEALEVLHKAEACRVYANRIRLARSLQNRCAELRLRAERRLGQLLATMPRRKRGQYPRQTSPAATFAPSLDELGFTRSQASRWQSISRIPTDTFEAEIAKAISADEDLTTAAFVRLTKTLNTDGGELVRSWGGGRAADSSRTLEGLIQTGQRFGCIYADPPWAYSNQGTRAATHNHYPTMSVEAIAELRVADLALPAAHLHLWTTNGFLFEARRIMEAWGFSYRSVFVWIKPTIGLGNYWRCSHEFLLLGVKGKAPFRNRSLRSWISMPRGAHSEKPEEVRDLIVQASAGPFIELFARRRCAGWTTWGNQLP